MDIDTTASPELDPPSLFPSASSVSTTTIDTTSPPIIHDELALEFGVDSNNTENIDSEEENESPPAELPNNNNDHVQNNQDDNNNLPTHTRHAGLLRLWRYECGVMRSASAV